MKGYVNLDPNYYRPLLKEFVMLKLFDSIPKNYLRLFTVTEYNALIAMDYYTYNYRERTLDYYKYKFNKENYRFWIGFKKFTWEFFTTTPEGKRYFTLFHNFSKNHEVDVYEHFFRWSFSHYAKWPMPIPVTHVFSKNNINNFYEQNYYKFKDDDIEKYISKIDTNDDKYITNKIEFRKYVDKIKKLKESKTFPKELNIFKERIHRILNKEWYKIEDNNYLAFIFLTQMPDVNWTSKKFFEEIENKIKLDKEWYSSVNPIYSMIKEELDTFDKN